MKTMKKPLGKLTALALALSASVAWGQAAEKVCTTVGEGATPNLRLAVASNFYEPRYGYDH